MGKRREFMTSATVNVFFLCVVLMGSVYPRVAQGCVSLDKLKQHDVLYCTFTGAAGFGNEIHGSRPGRP